VAKRDLKAGALLAPVPPALVTVSNGEEDNVLTVGWTGILATHPATTYVSIRPTRHSHGMLLKSGEFVIHLPPARLARQVDYCGTFTGGKVDKFEKCGFTKEPSATVGAPRIAECPVALECRVTDVLPMGSHDVFMADILRVSCHETLLDEKGKIHMERAGLLAYAHGEYYTLGKRVGAFGFSAAKKKKHPQKKAAEGAKKPQKKEARDK
jgi:flavin reductase (DIM6/NTAB) family NADH-FMN oxidoreductase RutF